MAKNSTAIPDRLRGGIKAHNGDTYNREVGLPVGLEKGVRPFVHPFCAPHCRAFWTCDSIIDQA